MITIGDHSLLSWLICLVYLYLATLLFNFDKSTLTRREVIFLLFNAVLLLVLGLNKQLDLQTIIFNQFKYYAHQFSVYEYKNFLKKVFVMIVMGAAILAALAVVKYAKTLGRNYLPLMTGWCLILLFIVLRVFYFEHDAFQTPAKIWQYQEYFQLIELLGLLLIYVSMNKVRKNKLCK